MGGRGGRGGGRHYQGGEPLLDGRALRFPPHLLLLPPESLARLHFSPRLVDVLVSTELDVIVRNVTVIMVSATILDRPKLFDP